jgi:hypothetical protein
MTCAKDIESLLRLLGYRRLTMNTERLWYLSVDNHAPTAVSATGVQVTDRGCYLADCIPLVTHDEAWEAICLKNSKSI